MLTRVMPCPTTRGRVVKGTQFQELRDAGLDARARLYAEQGVTSSSCLTSQRRSKSGRRR